MNSYNKPTKQLLEELGVSHQGLNKLEAEQRQKKFGPNQLREGKKKTAAQVFFEQFKDFLVIILLIAATISMFLKDIESSVVIFVVVIVNAILGTVQHQKAEQSLNSLKALSSPVAKVLRDGKVVTIPSAEVTIGDIVYLEAGDYICADGRILENHSMQVNESSLTGESVGVNKNTEEIQGEAAIGDRKNMVFSGSFVTYGRCTFVVTAIGMDTEIGKVATLLKNTQAKKTPLQVNLDNFGKKLSIIILIVCALLFALSMFRGEEFINAFMFAVALAVAAIPEALSSIVTIVLAFGTKKMAKENAIIRKLQAVEGLGSVSIICSDKTGTLTQNKMTVQQFAAGREIFKAGDPLTPLTQKMITFSVLCNDATNLEEKEIGDPTEVALINLGDSYGLDEGEMRQKYTRLSEVPFDSDRKLMSTLNNYQGKRVMVTKGAVNVLLERVKKIETPEGLRDITPADKAYIEKTNYDFSATGLRVLAFAYKETELVDINEKQEHDLIFMGLIAMMDPPRTESKKAVADCIKAGIRPIMITGDHRVTAMAIAKEIGILHNPEEAVNGAEIDNLTDDELKEFVEHVSVYARVSPEHKIRIVRAWQEKGNIVAMTGDGVNDAPALKQADIGVAMGITGSEVAKDAASMVLTDDNFATIVKAIENGRNVYANIKKSIKFLLSGNTAGLMAVLYASLFSLPVPFAPVHLLFINLLTDSLPAIALGLEPHNKDVMKEKPRPLNESILTKPFVIDIVIEGAIIAAATLFAFYMGLESNHEAASTMAFATLCLCRLFHGFNSKSKRPVLFSREIFSNHSLWAAFAIGFVLLTIVLVCTPLYDIFSIAPLYLHQLLTIYGAAFASMLVIQIIKYFRTKNDK